MGLQPVEPVRHHPEHRAETAEHRAEAAQHDAEQPAEVGPVFRGQCVDPAVNGLESPIDRVEAALHPLQRRGRGARDMLQDGNATLHVGRIPATGGRLNCVRHRDFARRAA